MTGSDAEQIALPKAEQSFRQVRQVHVAWCIPAGLEVVLRYRGIDVTQDALVLAYCRAHGDSALCCPADGHPIVIGGMSDEEILAAAQRSAFREGDFGSFRAAVAKVVDLELTGYELFHQTDRSACEATLRESIRRGDPCLLAAENPDQSFHIYAIAGFNGTRFYTYEPWKGRFQWNTMKELNSNYDSLVLRRLPEAAQPADAPDGASGRL